MINFITGEMLIGNERGQVVVYGSVEAMTIGYAKVSCSYVPQSRFWKDANAFLFDLPRFEIQGPKKINNLQISALMTIKHYLI